jgi:Domain of unknown function (DUF4189)
MTTSNALKRSPHIVAAVVLVAAATTVAGFVGAPAPANAADAHIALSLGYIQENPPVTMAGGSAIAANKDEALTASLTNCVNNGGSHCVNQVVATNGCAAAASNDYGEMTGASGVSLAVAHNSARNMLQNQQGAKVIVSGCSSSLTPPPPDQSQPPDQPQPPAPLLGPTVSWNPVLGGLQAHITDRSGVSSQCTYATDNYNRSFALPANSTYDLRIVPAIPRFRDWHVTINCDNGTNTQTTTYF